MSYGVVSPGLDHPPPRCGDGDLDRDMVPAHVPGTKRLRQREARAVRFRTFRSV